MNRLIVTTAMVILLFCSTGEADACTCVLPERTPEQARQDVADALAGSIAVFTGTVTRVDRLTARLDVDLIWKGELDEHVVMALADAEPDGSLVWSSCDYAFRMGRTYLVFAHPDTAGRMRAFKCAQTAELKHAQRTLELLETIVTPRRRQPGGSRAPGTTGHYAIIGLSNGFGKASGNEPWRGSHGEEREDMSIESAADWNGLREVGRIVRLTLDALAERVEVGVTTAELDAVAASILARHGARSAPAMVYGFPGTVLISVNDEVVHGVPGHRRLKPGDLVKLDVTAEKDGYVADAARTVTVAPAGDTATRLAECARAAFEAALAVARAEVRVNHIGRAVHAEVRRHGFAVVRGLAGHGVGRTIHEPPSVPNEYDPWQPDVLTEGLVLTIEPMISAGSAEPVQSHDGWTIRTRDGSLSAHYEHTLVITRQDPIILTAA